MSIWGNYLAMHARRQLAFGKAYLMSMSMELTTAG